MCSHVFSNLCTMQLSSLIVLLDPVSLVTCKRCRVHIVSFSESLSWGLWIDVCQKSHAAFDACPLESLTTSTYIPTVLFNNVECHS